MMNIVTFQGMSPGGHPMSTIYFSTGGFGALQDLDGADTTPGPSNMRTVPTETWESLTGITILHKRLLPDTSGHGEARGGLGQEIARSSGTLPSPYRNGNSQCFVWANWSDHAEGTHPYRRGRFGHCSADRLKGADRARAEVLFEAAEQARCIAHLALITLWQLGDVDYDHSDYSRRRRRRYGSWYDDDHDEGPGSEHEMGEIIDTSLTASHWADRHGNARQFGEMTVDDDEVVTGDALDDGEPSEEEFEDYTGNAGLTLERWYHRAAIVIWPRERHFAVRCGAGTQAAIGGLEAMVKGLRRGSREQREASRRDGLQFAGAIIDGWKSPPTRWFGDGDDKADRSVFSKLLCKLDDPGMMRRFLSEIVPNDGNAELHHEFAKLCRRHGLSFEAS